MLPSGESTVGRRSVSGTGIDALRFEAGEVLVDLRSGGVDAFPALRDEPDDLWRGFSLDLGVSESLSRSLSRGLEGMAEDARIGVGLWSSNVTLVDDGEMKRAVRQCDSSDTCRYHFPVETSIIVGAWWVLERSEFDEVCTRCRDAIKLDARYSQICALYSLRTRVRSSKCCL